MKSRTRLPEGRTAEVDGDTSEARERQPVSVRPQSSGYAQERGQLRSGVGIISIAIGADRPPVEELNRAAGALGAPVQTVAGTPLLRTIAGMVEDALLLLLLAFVFAVAVLLIGTPIALCVRLFLEIARRL